MAACELRAAVRRIKALVWIHGAGGVGVRRNLPTGEVDRLEPGANHLHGLVARHRPECGDVTIAPKELPQAVGRKFGQGMVNSDRAPQTYEAVGVIIPLEAIEPTGGNVGEKSIERILCHDPTPINLLGPLKARDNTHITAAQV